MKIILKREGQRAQQLAFCFDKQLRLARESILSLIKFDLNKIKNKSREYSVQCQVPGEIKVVTYTYMSYICVRCKGWGMQVNLGCFHANCPIGSNSRKKHKI